MRSVLWMMVVLGLAACGGQKTESAGGGGSQTPEGDKVEMDEMNVAGGEHDCLLPEARQQELMASGILDGPPKPWPEMSHDDRLDYMATVVYPLMEEKFLAFDAERFADFGCETCHGDDASDRDYKMPSNDLMALHPTGSEEQIEVVRTMRPMAVFMFNDVVPTMRTLLGAPEFDVATGTGFSCYTCHPHGK